MSIIEDKSLAKFFHRALWDDRYLPKGLRHLAPILASEGWVETAQSLHDLADKLDDQRLRDPW